MSQTHFPNFAGAEFSPLPVVLFLASAQLSLSQYLHDHILGDDCLLNPPLHQPCSYWWVSESFGTGDTNLRDFVGSTCDQPDLHPNHPRPVQYSGLDSFLSMCTIVGSSHKSPWNWSPKLTPLWPKCWDPPSRILVCSCFLRAELTCDIMWLISSNALSVAGSLWATKGALSRFLQCGLSMAQVHFC